MKIETSKKRECDLAEPRRENTFGKQILGRLHGPKHPSANNTNKSATHEHEHANVSP